MGILALVLGIIGVIVALIPWYAVTQMIGATLGVVAIVLGVRARRQAVAREGRPDHVATAGLVAGIAALLLGSFVFASCQACKVAITHDPEVRNDVQAAKERFRQGVDKALRSVQPAGEGDAPASQEGGKQ